ncbi:MAG TPA: flagellar biosynthetic protein FliR [Myxococcaceae bacterium]|nr:flagellar biosynthetic protein FliR [Myxococcaceae bacterium]
MSARELQLVLDLLGPKLAAVALCGARLVPVALLCPLLGGQATPAPVKLGVVGSLALSLHLAGGVAAPAGLDGWGFAALVGRELAFGTAIGLVAALPFDAARIGGRFVDLFRGTSAEAALPVTGTRESATGDGLYQLLVALAVAGGAMPAVVSGLWRSFAAVPLGGFVASEAVALRVAGWVGGAFATGFAVGAPIAAASLAVDLFLGFASRAAPSLGLQEAGAPLRILGGGALLWLGVGVMSERLLAGVIGSEEVMRQLFEVAR